MAGDAPRVETGVRNLDAIFHGGLPKGSVVVVSGPPGSGKTILTQQICFHNASTRNRVLYFNTLSEPTAKTLRYLKQFSFFDRKSFGESVKFVDLGGVLKTKHFEEAAALIMEHIKNVKPCIVVIDSFNCFDDFAKSKEELRKFSYEIAVNLMVWETTAFLLGEYETTDHDQSPLLSIVDGLLVLTERESAGERQRFFRTVKMRGTDHSREEHAFVITSSGIEVFAPAIPTRHHPIL